jgi:hypothetical protein
MAASRLPSGTVTVRATTETAPRKVDGMTVGPLTPAEFGTRLGGGDVSYLLSRCLRPSGSEGRANGR